MLCSPVFPMPVPADATIVDACAGWNFTLLLTSAGDSLNNRLKIADVCIESLSQGSIYSTGSSCHGAAKGGARTLPTLIKAS